MFYHFLKISLRTLIRNKVYSLINIIGLSVGMTCFIFILLWANDQLNYDRYHKNIDDIYCAMHKGGNATKAPYLGSPWYTPSELKKEFPQLKQSVRIVTQNPDIPMEYQHQNFRASISFADSTLLDVFQFDFIEGNPKEALRKPFSLIVSEKAALNYFGTIHCLGKQINIRDSALFTITGIFKDVSKKSMLDAQFFTSMSGLRKILSPIRHGDYYYATYFLMDSKTINAKLLTKTWTEIKKKHGEETWNAELWLYPYKDLYLYNPFSEEKPITKVKLFLGIGILILIVACINFINLSSASYLQRTKEIGIRQTLGSNRWQLIQRFMSEAFLICGLVVVLSLFLSFFLLPYFNLLVEKEIKIAGLSPLFWCELIGLFFVTTLISGIYPALFLSRLKPNLILKSSFPQSNTAIFRKSLIVFQFMISILLIVATLLINSQLQLMKNKELGYNKDNLCYFYIDSKHKELKSELQKCPTIQSVSNSDLPHLPSFCHMQNFNDDSNIFTTLICRIDDDYIKTTGIKIIEGRFMSEGVKSEVVINEEFAKSLKFKTSVIGKLISISDKKYSIVGVAKNFQCQSLKYPMQPVLLFSGVSTSILVRYSEGSLPQTKEYIYQTLKRLGIKEKPQIGFVDEILERQYKSEQAQFQLFTVFSGLAILISCLGIMGLSLFETNRRTKEIGIRRVNGASILQMLLMLNRGFLKWVLIAFIVAVPISYYVMNRWLENFAYRTSLSWWIFAVSGLIALVIGLVSTSYQTLRAAKRNPIESLRYE